MAVQPTITRPTLPAAEHLIPRENGYGVHEVAPSPSASFADPWVVRELHSCGIAHLPVRLRDGAGLVGPLVVPGVTTCLGGHYGELPMPTRQDFDEALSTPTATRMFWIVATDRPDTSFS